jgi:hypothetical protein
MSSVGRGGIAWVVEGIGPYLIIGCPLLNFTNPFPRQYIMDQFTLFGLGHPITVAEMSRRYDSWCTFPSRRKLT